MMNKKEKVYFIDKLFMNFINHNETAKLQYLLNIDILLMFKHLNYISKEVYDELAPMIYKSAYEDKYSCIIKVQEKLCREMNIKVEN